LYVAVMATFLLSFNRLDRALGTRNPVRPLVNLAATRTSLFGARRVDDLAERIRKETAALFRFEEFTFALADDDSRTLDVRLHERNGRRLQGGDRPLGTGLFGWIVEHGEAVLVADWSAAPETLRRSATVDERRAGSIMAVPLTLDETVIGMLAVTHSQRDTWSEADLHLMRQLAEQVTAAVADARAFEDLENYRRDLEQRVAERTAALERANGEKERLIAPLRERSRLLERETQEDPLTGIANRRHFSQRLDDEIQV